MRLDATPNARRVIALYEHVRAHGSRELEAVRVAVLALYLDPGSALGRRPLPDLVRETMTRVQAILRAPASARPAGESPFLADALDLAGAEQAPLSTRHLVLSAWRQMRARTPADVVPSRLLLDLAGGDRASALRLYAEVLASATEDVDPPVGGPAFPASEALAAAARWVLT